MIMTTVSGKNIEGIPDIINSVSKEKGTVIKPVRYRELLATICEMEAYWDYDRFKKCSKCELKAWCRVCPAVASGAHRDFYNIDP